MSDGFFFLSVFFFLFAAWVASGGPSRPISFSGPFITPITNVGQTQNGYGSTNLGAAANDEKISIQNQIYQDTQQLTELQKQSHKDALFGTPSPYRGQVTIGSADAGATDANQQYLYLRNSTTKPITISGWKLTSAATDKNATIPNGDPLPSTGSAVASAPITLDPGQEAAVVTGASPLGASFLENSCLGYITQSQNFVPYISQSCPSPRDEFDRFYTGNQYKDVNCYNAVQNASSCKTPAEPAGLSNACYAFIDQHLTYSGCVANHKYDQHFTGTMWHIYLNYRDPSVTHGHTNDLLWKSSHEAIKLLDQNGKTVDLYSY